MIQLTRILAIVLATVLLLNQSAAFAYEQLHGAGSEVAANQSTPVPHEGGKGKDSCAHCAHGGHFQNHFLGHIAQPAPDWLLPLVEAMMSALPALRIPIASLEPPYRPPRIPG